MGNNTVKHTLPRLLENEPIGAVVRVVRIEGDGAFRQRPCSR